MKKHAILNYTQLPFLFLFLLYSTSCTSAVQKKKKKKQDTQEVKEKPSWVKQRPTSSLYYIGIASSDKHILGDAYVEATKKKALNDLASEIKVKVSSNSVLNSIEENDQFSESFYSNIKVSLLAELEGYELEGVFEDDNHYWVYYKLNKMTYAEIQERKRKTARQKSLTSYKMGLDFEKQKNYVSAVSSYTQALSHIEKYMNEENRVDHEGESIELGTTIFNVTQNAFNALKIDVPNAAVSLTHGLDKSHTIEIFVKDNSTIGISNIPLIALYDSPKKVVKLPITDANGKTAFVMDEFTSKTQSVQIQLDKNAFSELSQKDSLAALFLRGRQSPVEKISVSIKQPLVYATSIEKNFNKQTDNAILLNEIKKQLTDKGFLFTEDKEKANILLHVEGNTRKGNATNGLYISYLDASISMMTVKGEEYYKDRIENQKGIQLSFEQAGFDAYNKSIAQIKKMFRNF